MEFTPYQIVAPAIALIAVMYAWSLVFRQKKTMWEALLWTCFWGAVALIAFEPDVLSYLSTITGIKKRENAALVTFFGILFFMVFYIVIRLEELEQRLTRIIRKMALKDADIEAHGRSP